MILSKSGKNAFNPKEFRKNLLDNNGIGSLLSIVPTRRRIRNLSRYFIKESPAAVDSLFIETIETAAEKILKASEIKFSMLNDALSGVLLRECFEENKENLVYFPKENIPAGTVDKLKNLISEYKRHPIYPNDLIDEIAKGLYNEGDILKVRDIITLYNAYDLKCQQLRLKETGDLFMSVNSFPKDKFQAVFQKLYPSVTTIIIEGYNQFSNSEIIFIDALAEVCEVFIDFDFYKDNENVFSHIEVINTELNKRGWKHISSDEKGSELQDYLGNSLSKYASGKKDFSEKISFIECSTREKEVDVISKQIKLLLKNNECKPHRIGVLFNDIGKYSDLIRDKFSSSGIPYNLTDRKVLSSSLPVSAIFFFLQIKLNDFYYKDILRAFSNGFITLFSDKYNVNAGNLLQNASMLKITGGFNNWESQLKKALQNKELNSFQKSSLEKALADIIAIKKILAVFEKEMSVSEFHSALLDLIKKLNVVENIRNAEFNKEENARGFQKFFSVLDNLFELQPDKKSEEKFSLGHYIRLMSSALNRERFSLSDRPSYGVFVSNLDEARGLKFDFLFIGGLVDGELPTPYKPELLVLRKKEAEKITKPELQQIRERYLFYQTICSFFNHVYLSYPLFEEKRQFERSVFLRELENVLTPRKLSENDFSKIISCKEELLKNFNHLETKEIVKEVVPVDVLESDIQIEKLRESDISAESVYNGYIFPENESYSGTAKVKAFSDESIKNSLTEDKTYSISQFERYASCPFKYFAEKMLHLKTVDDPNDEIEKTELGSLIHDILCKFYTDFSFIRPVSEKQKNEALKRIFSIAEQCSEGFFETEKDFYEKEKIFGIGGVREDSILYKFVMQEIADESGFTPWKLEYEFNDYELDGVKIRGKIDRIDINEQEKTFRVIDYKLGGKAPTETELSEGLSLQLPIYIAIAKKILEKEFGIEYSPYSGCIYSLKISDEFGIKKTKRGAKNDPCSYIDISIAQINQYASSISRGNFNMTGFNTNNGCRFCDFQNLCRAV